MRNLSALFSPYDVAIAAWVVLWIVVGLLVAREVRALSQFGESLDQHAKAVESTAQALDAIADLPLVGGRIGNIERDLESTAAELRQSAHTTRMRTGLLSTLLGFSIAVIPSAPVLTVYLPVRIRAVRGRKSAVEARASTLRPRP